MFHDGDFFNSQAACDVVYPGSTFDGGLFGCRTYILIGTVERLGDRDPVTRQPIGNDNGVCESGETCTVLEHIGANQPQMTLGGYTFNGQFITGVALE